MEHKDFKKLIEAKETLLNMWLNDLKNKDLEKAYQSAQDSINSYLDYIVEKCK
jgi:hypothetical protein